MIWDLRTIITKNDKAKDKADRVTVQWQKAFGECAAKYCRLHVATHMLIDMIDEEIDPSDPLFEQTMEEIREILSSGDIQNVD